MKKDLKTYGIWIAVTEAVGGLSALLTREGTRWYNAFAQKPAMSPPQWLFPVAWGILYALMAVSAAKVYLSRKSDERSRGLILYFVQLGINFLWSIIFFNMKAYGFAFFWLLLLIAIVVWMTADFKKVNRQAALLQIPYIAWLLFAAYLNYNVWMLN